MSRSRIALGAALVLLASCGDGGGASVTATAPITSGAVTSTRAPTSTVSPTTATVPTTTTLPTSTSTLAETYSQAALDYFVEVAFGAEFGGGSREIRRWNQDVRIVVHGDPNDEDLATLHAVIADLNEIIGTIQVSIVEQDGNVDLHFAPRDQFDAIEPNYVSGNMGFFWVWWDRSGNITTTRVLVSTTGLTQEERNHIIREEITQQMGLMSDSYTYEDSIFQQAWTTTQEYSALDELVIEMLYLPAIEAGMGVAEVLAVLAP
ncbi:MAG TPA: DUF2927 domain-containing protein [Acidimicrobiia bacterium]|nr:DUF2927 domain-containing protein [Acidimicrobiia bacterium]